MKRGGVFFVCELFAPGDSLSIRFGFILPLLFMIGVCFVVWLNGGRVHNVRKKCESASFLPVCVYFFQENIVKKKKSLYDKDYSVLSLLMYLYFQLTKELFHEEEKFWCGVV